MIYEFKDTKLAFHSPIKFYIMKDRVIYRSIGVKSNLNQSSVDRMVVWFTKVPWNVLSGELEKRRYFPHCWSDEGTCTLNSKAASSYAKNQWEFLQVLLKRVTKNIVRWNLFRAACDTWKSSLPWTLVRNIISGRLHFSV